MPLKIKGDTLEKDQLIPSNPDAMKLLKYVTDRIDLSYRHLSNYFDVWDTAEEHYRAYRPTDEEDLESLKKHQVQKIIVPIQFATLETILTFMMEVFTGMPPVLKCDGADPISLRPARVMELLLGYDYRGNRGYLMINQWFKNALRYGYSVIGNSWGRTQVLKRTMGPGPPVTTELEGQTFTVPGAMQWVKEYFTTFEGNKWQIVDNRSWFRDPRVPLTRFQEGEFCGVRTLIHDNELLKLQDDGIFFNVDLVVGQGSSSLASGSGIEAGADVNKRDRVGNSPQAAFDAEMFDARRSRMHVNEEIIIELIPKDWGLSDEERPEQWIFNIEDRRVIVRCEASPFYNFPYAVIEAFPDILASMSMGIMELTEPLANHLNFLFNSHMANVRKALNDMLLVDPSRIELDDLLDPGAGKIIRLLPLAYGQDPSAAVKQLQVLDITASHITDVKAILELWARITGAADAMFGQISSGRRSAAELTGVLRSASSRMMMMANLFSSEGVAPLTEMMAITRQREMSIEQYVDIAGRTAIELGVSPDKIIDGFGKFGKSTIENGVFHFPAAQGVAPMERQKAAEFMQKGFEATARFPILMNFFDPVEMFKESMRQGGITNISPDFLQKGIRAQTTVMQDEIVNELKARGMLSPFNGGTGKGRPDTGKRRSERELHVEGFTNGAGSPR